MYEAPAVISESDYAEGRPQPLPPHPPTHPTPQVGVHITPVMGGYNIEYTTVIVIFIIYNVKTSKYWCIINL